MNVINKLWMVVLLVSCFSWLPSGCAPSPDPGSQQIDSHSAGSAELTSGGNSGSPTTLSSLGDFVLYQATGEETKLVDYMGKKNLVLVFSRGYFGSICPFCSTQMHELARAFPEFEKRNALIVVVFPISSSADQKRWKDLEASILAKLPSGSKLPFPILIDDQLAAVDRLGIREELSKPSTFIVDTSGIERYRYIGSDPADRPEASAILEKLDGLPHP